MPMSFVRSGMKIWGPRGARTCVWPRWLKRSCCGIEDTRLFTRHLVGSAKRIELIISMANNRYTQVTPCVNLFHRFQPLEHDGHVTNKTISIQAMPCRWWHAIQKVCLGSFELRVSQNLSLKNSFERSLQHCEFLSSYFPKDGRSFLSIYDGTTRYKLGLTTYDRSGGMAKNWKRCPGQHCSGFPNDSNGCGKTFTSFAGFFVHSSEEQASRSMQGFPRHSAAWAVPGTPRCSQQRIRRVTSLCQGPELSSWYVRS